jgi:hypothetical protein
LDSLIYSSGLFKISGVSRMKLEIGIDNDEPKGENQEIS